MRLLDLFSGIGGFSLAFEQAGCTTVAFSEVDPFACKVLAHHWPDVPNLGDIRGIKGTDVRADIVTGGTPCQDFSVAGKRAGIAGERSGLFSEFLRVIREMREAGNGPTVVVWENVPGAFSTNGGRDFASVLSGLAELGPLDIAWRVLDAQFFGVPQRRRRIFLVADFGGERAVEILALTDGVSGHPAPRRQAGEDIAPSLEGRAGRSGATNFHTSGGLIASSLGSRGNRTHTEIDGHGAYIPILEAGKRCGVHASTRDGLGIGHAGDPMFTLQSGAQHAVAAVPAKMAKGTGEPAGDECQNLVFDQHYQPSDSVVPTLIGGTGGGGKNEMNLPLIAHSLRSADGPHGHSWGLRGDGADNLVAHSLRADGFDASEDGTGRGTPLIQQALSVRRLTPREAERLQGFPDDWTALPGAADGPRYRALGNAVAVPVVEWIARRLVCVTTCDIAAEATA